MSPIAAESLIQAALRRPTGEDQVTEVLAACLQHDNEARRAVCDCVKAPSLANAVVITQRLIPTESGRIDCELRLTEGSRLYVIWLEVKVDLLTGEQHDQLLRYARELRRLYGDDGTLVVLAPDGHHIFDSAAAPLEIGHKGCRRPDRVPADVERPGAHASSGR